MSDTISRQAVKEMMKNHRVDFSTEKDYRTARACANAVPSAQPKRGKWTADNACSECGCQPWYSRDIHIYNYCPNCGAKMEVTE